MFNIGDFLEKFKNITPPNKFIKDELISVLREVVGVEVEKDSIRVIKGTIFISADPIIKNEIFLKKDKIMEELIKKLSVYKKTIKGIR